MHEARREEQPGETVHRSPALVVAEESAAHRHHQADTRDTGHPAGGPSEIVTPPREQRPPTRQDGPHRERHQSPDPDLGKSSAPAPTATGTARPAGHAYRTGGRHGAVV